jgi:type IVB pilus formation R64 PilN family outer membrane protein
MTFRDVAELITRQTKIPVIARDGDVGAQTATAAPGAGGSADISQPKVAQGPAPAGFDAARALDMARAAQEGLAEASLSGSTLVSAGKGTMSVNYTGPLGGFLDVVGDAFNYGWEYDGNRIVFTRTQVATFDIPALPIVMKLAFALDSGASSSASGGSGGGGSSGGTSGGVQQTGGSSQKASTDAAFNLWNEMEKTMKNIVGKSGTIDISGSTGTVTANAPAAVINQLRKYVKRINRELSREIVLAVDVYSVRLNKGDNYNLDLNVMLQKAGEYGVGYMTPGATAATTVANVLAGRATGNGGVGAAVLNANSQFYGSNALVQALSTQGDVSIMTSANLTTLNGIPAPFQVINTRGYVAQVSTTVTAGTSSGATQTSLTPGTVTTGFNLYVVPRVDKNGSVLLQYGVNISELVGAQNGFDTFSSGGQTVQLPNINARNFVQEASVPINGTLVLTGFEQKNDKNSGSGVGDGHFPLFGGGVTASHGREVVVVSITPRVISFGAPNAVE